MSTWLNTRIGCVRSICLMLSSPSYVLRYVDSQLRRSRRFDAEGLRRDHPDLFQPFPKRSSSTHSLSSVSSTSTHTEYNDDGQLRYWTSSMCRNSPHWFDFVVTVSFHSLLPSYYLSNFFCSSVEMAQSCLHRGSSNALFLRSYRLPWVR